MASSTNTHGNHASALDELQVLPDDISYSRKQDQREFSAILRRLPIDPLGIFSLGNDGVLRSLTANREVLGAVPLEPRLIKAYLDRMDYDEELEAEFRGIDGTKAPREYWARPPLDVLPPPLEGSKLEEAKKFMKENGMSFDVKPAMEGMEPGDESMCPVVVMSDHDILKQMTKVNDTNKGKEISSPDRQCK